MRLQSLSVQLPPRVCRCTCVCDERWVGGYRQEHQMCFYSYAYAHAVELGPLLYTGELWRLQVQEAVQFEIKLAPFLGAPQARQSYNASQMQ